jgi:DNA-binding response OmpR family regulator
MPGACVVQGANQLEAAISVEQPARILVVDDDPVHCLLIRRILESTYEVVEANDGLDGVRAFHEVRPDLVLLDTVLPRLNGWEVLRRIREVADTPVIMLTVR